MVKSSSRPAPVATLLSGVALTCLAGAVLLSPGVAAAAPVPVAAVSPLLASPDGGGDSGDDDFSVECADGGCTLDRSPGGVASSPGGGDINIEHADKVDIDNADIERPEDSPGFLSGLFKGISSMFGGGSSSSDGADESDRGDRGDHEDAGLSKDDVEELLERQREELSKQLPPMPQSVPGGGEAAPTAGPPVDKDGIEELVQNFVDDLLKLLGVS